MTERRVRCLFVAVAALAAAPALAYILPVSGILKRVAQRREELGVHALEVRGTLSFAGDAAGQAATALGVPLSGAELGPLPAVIDIRMPGRCRIEVATPDTAPAERRAVVSLHGRVAGGHGLELIPAAAALIRGVCALLGERPAGGGRAYAEELARLGVDLHEAHLGRLGGRIAYVIGARPSQLRSQAWVDKQSFQPVRVMTFRSGAVEDIRLLDYGSSMGGDWFPRAVEVYLGAQLAARFTTEKALPNPKLSDAMF